MARPKRESLKLEYRPAKKRREWRAWLYDNKGKLHRLWLGETDREAAKRTLAQLENAAREHARRRESGAVQAMIDRFLEDRSAYLRPASQTAYRAGLAKFLEYLTEQGITRRAELEDADIRGLASWLRTRYGYRDASVNAHMRPVRTMLRYFALDATARQLQKIRHEERKPRRPVTVADFAKLIKAAGEPMRSILWVAVGTGMRRGELTALQWADVDRGRGLILIHGKGAKDRLIPLLPFVLEIIDAQPHTSPYVFPGVSGERDGSAITRRLVAICKRAGINRISPHDLRKASGGILLEAGVDLRIISQLYGHVSIDVTMEHYLVVSDRLRREAMEPLTAFRHRVQEYIAE